MGMDWLAVIPHHLSTEEIIALPRKIDGHRPLREAFDRPPGAGGPNPRYPTATWLDPRPFTTKRLNRLWDYQEADQSPPAELGHWDSTELCTYFGSLTIYRRIVVVNGIGSLHKYSNLQNDTCRTYLFRVINELARLLDATSILYTCDGYQPPALLMDKMSEGWPLTEVIAYGEATFGAIPDNIEQAVQHYFFTVPMKSSDK